MTRKSCFFSMFFAALVLLAAPAAHASYDNCTSGQLPMTSAMANNMQSSLEEGARVSGSTVGTTINIDCASSWTSGEGTSCQGTVNWALVPYSGGISKTAFPNVYRQAGMPSGIGYQFIDAAGNPMPLDRNSRVDTGVAIRTGNQTVPLRVVLIKLDNTAAAGTFNLRLVLGCTSNEYANVTAAQSTIDLTVTTKLLTQTCAMSNADVQVALPVVTVRSFPAMGSTSGSTMVPLAFQCQPNVDARVNFSDAASPTNTGTALTLQAGSTATGVGVQLVYAGNPVRMSPNEDFNIGGTDIQLANSSGGTTVVQMPLLAQYVRTGTVVTPGSVQARALVNIAYN